jgi:hypothetical protein
MIIGAKEDAAFPLLFPPVRSAIARASFSGKEYFELPLDHQIL